MSPAIRPVVACVQWVDLRPEIDLIHATVSTDPRRHGFSDADRAAFEVALRLGERRAAPVWLVGVAPPAAVSSLRELAACGASRVVRIDGVERDASLARIASALADVCATAQVVVCGDYGLEGGSGAVPGMIAHHLGAAQALGIVEVSEPQEPLRVVRRLDGGRREHLSVPSPCVISTEGAAASLRRAPLRRRGDGVADVEVVAVGVTAAERSPVVTATTVWRPRPRDLAAPDHHDPRLRVVALTGALVDRNPPRRVELDPADAADAILEQLRAWGYLE